MLSLYSHLVLLPSWHRKSRRNLVNTDDSVGRCTLLAPKIVLAIGLVNALASECSIQRIRMIRALLLSFGLASARPHWAGPNYSNRVNAAFTPRPIPKTAGHEQITCRHRDTRQRLTVSDPLQQRRSIMVQFMLAIIGLAGAMTVPAFLTAIVESTASKHRPASVRTASPGRRI